ncbi:uncharacterized protein LOC129580892 [Paramacrobiotus metropolitanus]|uniref:uncharacterized protein LOC129580892 n=1 Tax=Paramacrobiotus metropolitanus TaxID=2943436 RepID=UPI002445A3AB|nr:uncharacterized protein LOC129580892 [Paramacrobiotus metropolitanus]
MEELLGVHGKTVLQLTLGILLVIGVAATAPTPTDEQLALLCTPWNRSAPTSEQIQALADCVMGIGMNFRPLADAAQSTISMPTGNGSKITTLQPPTNTTTVCPPPRGTRRPTPQPDAGHVPLFQRLIKGLVNATNYHPFFTFAIIFTILGLFMLCIAPLSMCFIKILVKRSVRDRILMVGGLIVGILVGAFALDSLLQSLY